MSKARTVHCKTFFEMFASIAKHVEDTNEAILPYDDPVKGLMGFATSRDDGVEWLVRILARTKRGHRPYRGHEVDRLSKPIRLALRTHIGRLELAKSMADPKFRGQFFS